MPSAEQLERAWAVEVAAAALRARHSEESPSGTDVHGQEAPDAVDVVHVASYIATGADPYEAPVTHTVAARDLEVAP